MNHHDLSDELRAQLIESASWGKAGITPRLDEGAKKGDKSKDKPEDKADYETGERKGDKSNQKSKKGDKGDFTTDQRKGDKSKTHKGEDFEEETAAHACPLCASELSEAIDEDRLLEHLDIVVGLVDRLSQLQEGEQDIDTVIDETIAELLLQSEEE